MRLAHVLAVGAAVSLAACTTNHASSTTGTDPGGGGKRDTWDSEAEGCFPCVRGTMDPATDEERVVVSCEPAAACVASSGDGSWSDAIEATPLPLDGQCTCDESSELALPISASNEPELEDGPVEWFYGSSESFERFEPLSDADVEQLAQLLGVW